MEKLATGIPGFDELANGGLPRGRATLVVGRSGTGKTIFCLQAACQFAAGGARVLFLSAEEAPADLTALGDAFGFGPSELAKNERLVIHDLVPDPSAEITVSGAFGLQGIANWIGSYADSLAAEVIVLDSLSALLAPVPESSRSRHLLVQLLSALGKSGRTVICSAGAGTRPELIHPLGSADYVCDVVVIMRNVADGKRRRRTIEVQKYRRSGHLKGEYPAAITKFGLSVFPLDSRPKTGRQPPKAAIDRFPSGVSGLDDMTHGGWLRDAIVLVRGPTGSGKTILSGMYACAGAARGERVFYSGFEENEGVLLRNFDRLGLPFRRHVEAGDIELVARYPEATSPEDMIIELRTVLDRHTPSLIVLDSISAIEHVTSYESFRQFVVGVSSALRQHGRSALLTQSVGAEMAVDDHAPYLSTLADAILLLGYRLTEEDMIRYIRVLKMRGSAHSVGSRRLAIGEGGLSVPTE
ncbi:MAG: ATPase domain-containing protein [Myxococcota bacterium]